MRPARQNTLRALRTGGKALARDRPLSRVRALGVEA